MSAATVKPINSRVMFLVESPAFPLSISEKWRACEWKRTTLLTATEVGVKEVAHPISHDVGRNDKQ